ncbi:phospho-sugar mutase, partial [Clostridium sp.]|uniref:phospho-sugar mutase n=1 Tax=Clostridium sp. TaxID=1506 RepID=UPI00346476BD
MYKEKYNQWIESSIIDLKTKEELKSITDEKEIEDRFYKDLEFGTGGLRGVIGAGSNRMNIYTVGKATQGYCDYLNNMYKNPSVAIAYDSRIMSKEFATRAALVFAANKVKVHMFEDLRPTPMLSFAVRELECSGGIVITASHNPKQYNGYKVYGDDGCQVTDNLARDIIECVNNVEGFEDVKHISEKEAMDKGLLNYIESKIDESYIEKVKGLTIRKDLVSNKSENLNIIYTPIHGSGLMPINRVLRDLGYSNLTIVEEQREPNGEFPTVPYPNPEDPRVFDIALEKAKEINADVIFGTDPDCDRIGVVIKDNSGQWRVLTGNQTGMLLANYIASSLKEMNLLKENSIVIKTIVTTDSIKHILKDFNVEVLEVLTGFKYIGEKIREFEENNSKNFIFGLEESYGYLAGDFVRDKDAVIAATLIAEMSLYYKERKMSLYDGLIEIYEKYGYSKEKLISIDLKGKEGQEKIVNLINRFRDLGKDDITDINIVKK